MNKPEKLSLKDAAAQRAELIAKAESEWRDFAVKVHHLIPLSMYKWARARGFVETPDWRLPEWLGGLVDYATRADKYPRAITEKYHDYELGVYGFQDFNDLKRKFEELATAWKDIVRIQFDERELPGRILVHYYAAESMPKLKPTNDEES